MYLSSFFRLVTCARGENGSKGTHRGLPFLSKMIVLISTVGPLALFVDSPVALMSWVNAHTKWLIVAAIFVVPVVALIQGAYFLVRYRLRYGDESPVPLLPAHGVVVVSPADKLVSGIHESDGAAAEASSFCSILFGHDGESHHPYIFESRREDLAKGIYSRSVSTSSRCCLSDWERIRRAAQAPPLRLLMIGDSLAAGVGVSKSATPVLPEVIAKSLSKALGGRAVFWTCIAEPGASSGWIVRELESFQSDERKMNRSFTSSSSQRTLSSLFGEEELRSKDRKFDEDDEVELDEWRNRLSQHSKRLKSEIFREFDVACIMTGLNDLKGSVLPCLLQGDEIEFRREARERGGDYTSELKRVVDAVAEKMKTGLKKSLDRVRTSVDNFRDRVSGSIRTSSLLQRAPERMPLAGKESSETQACMSSDESITDPLVVLPALPSNLPVMQVFPFIYFMLPLIRIADRIKQRLAERYPHAILYVEPSSVAEMLDFENCRGIFYDRMVKEDTLLSLIDISPEESEQVEDQMNEYYGRKGKEQIRYIRQRGERQQPREVIQPANVRLGAPGASLLSLDGIHPNDIGYNFWGRCIAAAILREWDIKP